MERKREERDRDRDRERERYDDGGHSSCFAGVMRTVTHSDPQSH
jgi:hypothetical protein